jgi:hypothetical protein
MPFKSQMNRFIVFIILMMVIALSMGCNYFYQRYVNHKLTQVKKEQKEIATGVETVFVDDCSGMLPGPDNYIPVRLTTPIAYVKTLYHDPFSPANEPYRYIDQPGRGNGAMYLVASRGPDGDWDVTRIPTGVKRFLPVKVPFDAIGVRYVKSTTDSKPNNYYNFKDIEYYITRGGKKVIPENDRKPSPEVFRSYSKIKYKSGSAEMSVETSNYYYDIEYYISSDGQRHDASYMIFRDLPINDKNSGWLSPKGLQEFLASYQIAIYDPTNGLTSDGDIIFSNAR